MTRNAAPESNSRAVSIRLAHEDDVDRVFEVRLSVRENELTMEQLAELGVTPEGFREELRRAPATWVAEADGRILGFATGNFANGSVFALFVDPESEGRGIGGALLDTLEAELFSRFPVLWLETDASSRAQAFYARRGWENTAELPEGDVRMEKRVPAPKRLDPLSARVQGPVKLSAPEADEGLSWQGLRRKHLPALLELERAGDAVDDPESVTDLADLEERFEDDGFDPVRDSIIAFDLSGNAVAYGEAFLEASGESVVTVHLNGVVHPDHRGRGVGQALLRWQEGRGEQHLEASPLRLPARLSTLVPEAATGQRALFESAGYAPMRWWLTLERSLADDIAEPELGSSLRIERYRPERSESARQVINEAFQDHWGSQPTSREEWEAVQATDDFRAEWSAVCIATDASGAEQLVGVITVEADEDEWEATGVKTATVDELGVARAWRGRGIARALLTWSMGEQRAAGIARTTLDVDSASPTGARSLYEGLGFRETGRAVTYAKDHG